VKRLAILGSTGSIGTNAGRRRAPGPLLGDGSPPARTTSFSRSSASRSAPLMR
jgi:hypothetical protein